MKKKLSTIILSVFLAVLMGCLFPVQVFADQPTYIKELKMEYADTIDEAKSALEKKGYTPIDGDFGRGGKQAVAVGYIATDDKSEAITDLKVMEEECGYSFTEYEAYLKKQKDEVNNLYNDLKAAIDEFRENYAAETEGALFAYKMMNYYTNEDIKDEDGNAIGLGDMFISEDTTADQFKTLLLQGNMKIVASIEEYLGIACASNNWVEEAENCEEIASDENATASQLSKAKNIYNTLETFQTQIKAFEALSINGDSTQDEVDAFVEDENTTDEQKAVALEIYPIYNTLKTTSYLDGTLYDLFMSDLNDSKLIKKLVPLAEIISDGQIATFSYVPLYESIKAAQMDDETWTETNESETTQNVTENLKNVSVYSGVDRTIFTPDGIAMTTAALQQQDSTNTSEFGRKSMTNSTRNAMIALCSVGAVVTAVGATIVANATNIADKIFTAQHTSGNLETYVLGATEDQFLDTSIIKNCRIIGGVAIAIGAALLIYSLVNMILGFIQNKENTKHTELPRIMVDAVQNSDDTYDMTYYYAVKTLAGKLGDLNSWNGIHWIALYYTKDTKAGKPLTTDFVVKYGDSSFTSSDKVTYRAVSMFGSKAAKNLNNNGLYDKNNSAARIAEKDHVYLYVAEASAATTTSTTTASVFSGNNIYIFLAAFVGLLVGNVSTMVVGKKKIKKLQDQITTSN